MVITQFAAPVAPYAYTWLVTVVTTHGHCRPVTRCRMTQRGILLLGRAGSTDSVTLLTPVTLATYRCL